MFKERRVLVASSSGISVRSPGDVADVIGVCFGADGLILTEEDVAPGFFDLHTGLAGELFQKFMNYGLRVALMVPDPAAYGPRFSELAYEHKTHNLIRFVRSDEEAKAWLYA